MLGKGCGAWEEINDWTVEVISTIIVILSWAVIRTLNTINDDNKINHLGCTIMKIV